MRVGLTPWMCPTCFRLVGQAPEIFYDTTELFRVCQAEGIVQSWAYS